MESSLNFIQTNTGKNEKETKKINLYKQEDKKTCEEFMAKFQDFMKGNDKTLIVQKYPRYVINYILSNIHEEIRKILYFEYSTFEK